MLRVILAVVGAGALVTAGMHEYEDEGYFGPTDSGSSFVNWENHPIHGLALTPDGSHLLVTNTPDNRLEVYSLTGGSPRHIGSVPVGLDPVSVRARTNDEVWVVNHISDSISIVDLPTMRVRATIETADEPFDVVFAGTPQRAFVACSQVNVVQVFDPLNPTAAPSVVAIGGEDPRAMAVSLDGQQVYVAVWESGNASTILGGGADGPGTIGFPPNVVSNPLGPYGGVNPPPNAGNSFSPAMRPGNPPPPRVGMIVKRDDQGRWMDDNNRDWTNFVSGPNAASSGRIPGWTMPDRDLAVIDASSLGVSYVTGLMNINMGIGVNPATGDVTIVGTDGINEVRFEPNVNGVFIRVLMATVGAGGMGTPSIVDLNPHLTYTTPTIPMPERLRSIGDPRAVVWDSTGQRGYVAGMGSNNVIVIDPSGARAGLSQTIPVGEGPTSLAIDESRDALYVLNRFEGSISVVSLSSETEVARIPYFDPSPQALKVGRKHLYDTHLTSGLGQSSCASCHVDARMDRLSWDLGDPPGAVKSLAGLNLGAGIPGLEPNTTPVPFAPFHPMKGPMTTQTLQGIIGLEPHHWRGDRLGLEEFNPAFEGLLGNDRQLTPAEMQEFEDMLATIHFPPNPNRNFDNTLPQTLPLPGHFTSGRFSPAGQPLPPGRPNNGLTLYRSTARRLDGGAFACVTCHTLPTGAGADMVFSGGMFQQIAPGPNGERHIQVVSVDGSTNRAIKTPHLRNVHEKVGFETTQLESRAGFGFLHDGSVDSIARFVSEPAFNTASDQEVADLVAFMLCFAGSELPQGSIFNLLEPPGPPSIDTHAGVGKQVTVSSLATLPAPMLSRITSMQQMASQGRIGIVVKGRINGEARGFAYQNGNYQSDRAAEVVSPAALLAMAAPGSELTYTAVPTKTAVRIGIDRDEDGHFDRDELDRCADPADPTSFPGAPGNPDCDASTGPGVLDIFDFLCFGNAFSAGQPYACDCDVSTGPGICDVFDFLCFGNAFAAGCE